MLSINSYGEWTMVNKNVVNDSYYINFQTLKEVDDGYVVWWEMRDNSEARDGSMSTQILYKGDCVSSRTKFLAMITYTGAMGSGTSEDISGGFISLEDIMGWSYPPPDSVTYDNLAIACKYESKVQEGIDYYKDVSWGDDVSSNEYVDDGLNEQQKLLQSTWVNNISARVKTFWRYQGAEDDWWCNVYVSQKRNGEVKAVDVGKCHNMGDTSRAQTFKNSLKRSVYKSSPLPSAPDDSVFEEEIMFTFFVN